MLCPRCQKTVDSGAAFCGNCGFQLVNTAVSGVEPLPQMQAQPTIAPAPQPEQNPVQPSRPVPPFTWSPQPPTSPQLEQASSPPSPDQALQAEAYSPAPQMPVQQVPPGYPLPAQHDHSGKAIASFVLAVLGLPACLIPIVGIVLGVLAIVFGSLSIHSARKIFAIIGMSIAVIVLLASIFFWVRNTQELVTQHKNGSPLTSTTDNSSLQDISTPCYTTKVPKDMKITQTSGSCTFSAASTDGREQEVVKVLQVPQLTLGNLSSAAKSDAANVVNAIPGGSISGQRSSTFGGSQAYEIEIKATDGSAGIISYVYNTTMQGNLVIVLHTQARASGNNYDLSRIESNWSWL